MFISDRTYKNTRRGCRLKKFEELNGNYTKIPNELLNDRTISWKAKGLFCHMASKTDNFHFTVRVLAKNYPDGKASIYSALEELKNRGWISYTRKAEGYSKYILNSSLTTKSENRNEAERKSENRDEANEPYSENQTKDAHPYSENRTNEPNPHTENRDTDNRSSRKSGCINKNIAFNNKDFNKEQENKPAEQNSNLLKDQIDSLSAKMSEKDIFEQTARGH